MVTDSLKPSRRQPDRIVRGVPLTEYKVLAGIIAMAKKKGIHLTWDDMVRAKLCKPAKRESKAKFRQDATKRLEAILGFSLEQLMDPDVPN
jgi:hypothetical protein